MTGLKAYSETARLLSKSTILCLRVRDGHRNIEYSANLNCYLVEVILRKCKKEHLMLLYNIPFFTETKDFLIAVARSRGRLKKGGVPDLFGACRMILRDWNAGRIPYYTLPPCVTPSTTSLRSGEVAKYETSVGTGTSASLLTSTEDIGSAAIMSELAPEFDLDGLFHEADLGALENLKTSRELGPGNIVRLNESVMGMTIEAEKQGTHGELQLMGEESHIENLDEDMEGTKPETATSTTSRKRVLDASPAPTQIKQKRVNFSEATLSSSNTSQQAKMLADTPLEIPTQLNKAIKQQAKKEKKKRRTQVDRDLSAGAAVGESDAGTVMESGKTQPYDFAKFFGVPKVMPDQDEPM